MTGRRAQDPVEPPPSRWRFPDPALGREDIVARGGDLEPGTLLAAYRSGLFPMPMPGPADLAWFSPIERAVLPVRGLRVTRSMRRSARRFTVTVDQAFGGVVAGCADPSRPGGWIDHGIALGYQRLHDLGWAHSVEVWGADGLAGGLYGVAIGGLFCGESMFHVERDASKVALMALVDMLDDGVAVRLVDVQWATPHLESLGVVVIGRDEYLRRLPAALAGPSPRLIPPSGRW